MLIPIKFFRLAMNSPICPSCMLTIQFVQVMTLVRKLRGWVELKLINYLSLLDYLDLLWTQQFVQIMTLVRKLRGNKINENLKILKIDLKLINYYFYVFI